VDSEEATRLWDAFRRTGDPLIFEQLYRAYRENLLRYCRGFLRDEEAAEEVTTSTFVALFLRRPAARKTFPSMLFAWASKLCIRYQRERKHPRLAEPLVGPAASDPPMVEREELHDAIARAVLTLPLREREVLLLQAFHGSTFTEIAGMLAISRWAVVRRYNKALRRLRGLLDGF
jgi:RNA polymerase sigma factor (sigma-70 family)